MKTPTRLLICTIIILMAVSCRPGTEPLEYEEIELKEIESAAQKVIRPNYYDLLYAGGKFSTQWDLGFTGGYVNLHLYKGGTFVYTVASETLNDQCFKWKIPDDLQRAPNYRLKVESVSDPANYGYSTWFTINKD